MAASKVCSTPRCPHLKPCPIHTPKPWESSNRRAELPDNWSTEIVPRIKQRDHYTCTKCGGRRCHNQRLEVHHVGDPHDHQDTNLATLGKRPCHDEETRNEATHARTTGPRHPPG